MVSRIAGGVALVALLSVVAIVMWSKGNQTDSMLAVRAAPPTETRAMGDLTGYVGRVDQKARTVEVAEDRLGLHPVTMTVTDDTSIQIRGERAAFGDLVKDLPVRAYYEVRNDVKYVTSIQVITDDAHAQVVTPAPAEPRAPVEAKPPMETRPIPPATVASTPPARRRPAPTAQSVTPRAIAPTAAEVTAPAPVTSAAPPAPSAALPADTDAADGSAAVDWVFRGLLRR